MKLVLGGVRGTCPVSRAGFLKYGGETTSFLIEAENGTRTIIDAGTGVRMLGQRLEATDAARVLILMTHYHLDHLTGMPALNLIYSPRWQVEMAAPVREGIEVHQAVPGIMHKPYWPLQMDDLAAHLRFITLEKAANFGGWSRDGLTYRWCPIHHPDGCTAYRIDEDATGASLVIATDIEWSASTPDEQRQLLRLCTEPRPASLLLFDGQFTEAELPKVRGWGHSTWNEAVAIARETRVGRLLITHHAPAHDDVRLDALEAEIKAAWPAGGLAREGMEIELRRPVDGAAQQ